LDILSIKHILVKENNIHGCSRMIDDHKARKDGLWDYWYEQKLGVVEPEIPKLGSLLRINGGRRVLDVGCGIGRHVIYFAENGFETFGFDLSKSALDRARALLSERNLKADLTMQDMFELFPYASNFFDGVISTRALGHGYRSDIERSLAEIDRVLVNKGLVFLQLPSWSEGERVENPKAVEVEPRTLLWYEGEEANVPHHHFLKDELLEQLKNYEVIELHRNSDHYTGWCVIARKLLK
jgi:SAM-dependent methyltransferase